nr:hypothetical protein [Breoghania sp.]
MKIAKQRRLRAAMLQAWRAVHAVLSNEYRFSEFRLAGAPLPSIQMRMVQASDHDGGLLGSEFGK